MSQSSYLLEKTFDAENDLSSKQYYFVELGGSDNQVDVCDGAGDLPIGVLQNEPEADEAANVRIGGTTKIVASAAITKGAYVGTTNAGKAVAKTADGDIVRGIALEAAAVDGDIIEILLVFAKISVPAS